jgi:hypothetical protein
MSIVLVAVRLSLMKFLALLVFVWAAVNGMDAPTIGQQVSVDGVEYPSRRTYTRVNAVCVFP